jgi:hypothetical protein
MGLACYHGLCPSTPLHTFLFPFCYTLMTWSWLHDGTVALHGYSSHSQSYGQPIPHMDSSAKKKLKKDVLDLLLFFSRGE